MNWADVGIAAGRWALANSGSAAFVAILVLLVQKLLGDRISARWRHNLWLLVVVRLLLPTLPGINLPLPHWPHQMAKMNPVNVSTELPKEQRPAPTAPLHRFPGSDDIPVSDTAPAETIVIDRPGAVAAPVVDRDIVIPAAQSPVAADTGSPRPFIATVKYQRPDISPTRPIIAASLRWRTWALLLWLAGTIAIAGFFAFTTIRLRLATRRLTPVEDEAALRLLKQCGQLIGLRRLPLLVSGRDDFGPALVGLFRPRLVIPKPILAGFSQHELRSILLHELTHHRRRDVAVNYLLAALTSIHWFNPLVWFAFSRLRAERELACDQAVMNLFPPRERLAYGGTILKLLELAGRGPLVPTAVGVTGKKGLMQRRIAMIARFDRRPPARPLAAAFLSILVGGAALTAPTFAQEKGAPIPTTPETPPAVDQARQAVEAAAKPQVPTGTIPPPLPVPDPAAAPPTATAPPAPGKIDVAPAVPGVTVEPSQAIVAPPIVRGGRSADVFANSPRSIEDASATAANAKTMERLKQSHPLQAQGVPLREVLRQIADIGKLDIVTDDKAISDAGTDLDTPINMNVHEPRPLEQLLEMSLRLASPGIDYSVLNGVIFVSSRDQLSTRIVTRVYEVGDANHDALTDLLINGTGLVPRVSFVGNKLVVTASELTQRHIAELLSAVSDQMSQKRVSRASRGAQDTTVHALRFADPQSVRQVLLSCSPDIKVVIDNRTNSMIITGGPDDQKLASALIAKLDQPTGEKAPPKSAEDSVSKLRDLAQLAIKMSQTYGARSQQLEDVARQVDALGTDVSNWIDRLAKEGNMPAAEKLRNELSQIKDLLAPLARESDANRPPEAAR